MSLATFTVQHGKTLDEARGQMQASVAEVKRRFGPLVRVADAAPDGSATKLTGTGFEIALRVDDQNLHVTADLTGVGAMLAGPLVAGLKQIVQQKFHKRLTDGKGKA